MALLTANHTATAGARELTPIAKAAPTRPICRIVGLLWASASAAVARWHRRRTDRLYDELRRELRYWD